MWFSKDAEKSGIRLSSEDGHVQGDWLRIPTTF
jgi:hypothetical protein